MTVFQWSCAVLPAATLAAVCLHYVLFGPKHPECAGGAAEVLRFRLWERAAHGVTLLAFLVLAGTGFPAVLAGGRLEGAALLLHWVAAPVFALGACGIVLLWHRSAAFEAFDIRWFRVMGGYLSRKDISVPAGRFNAGQKAFFWLAAVLCLALVVTGMLRMYPVFDEQWQGAVLLVHRWAALLLFCMVLVHAYLGTLANPGTVRAMLTGRVSRAWARAHHPVWVGRLGITDSGAGPDSDAGGSQPRIDEPPVPGGGGLTS